MPPRHGAEAATAAMVFGANVDESMQPGDVRAAIASVVRVHSADHVAQTLQKAGIAAHPVADAARALADAHPRDRGTIVQIEDSGGASFPVVGLPWRSYQKGQLVPHPVRAFPDLGADTKAVLIESGFSEAEIQQLSALQALR